jgi:replicative DNA helicase
MSEELLFEVESEKSYLGSILQKSNINLTEIQLVPDDFYSLFHKHIYSSLTDLVDKGITIDPISVLNHLRENSKLKDENQDQKYLLGLYRDTIVLQPPSYYARRIKKYSDRRKYLQVLQESKQKLIQDPDDNEGLFTFIESELAKISRQAQMRGLRKVSEDAGELIDYIKLMVETKGQSSGLKTHFDELDEVTTGLKPGELMILAARPGWGKTTLALNIATNVALKEQKNVAIFSLEMSRTELLLKVLCSDARINSYNIKTGNILQSDQKKLFDSILKIKQSPIWIDDYGALTIWELKSRIRQLIISNPVSLIVIDYLQLVDDPTIKEGRQQVVSSISRNLKQLAKEANCPIIALSQMNRTVEQRSKDQRPQLSDLRESGAIEQDADIVAFIYREDKVKASEDVPEEQKNIAEVIIAKNRSGQTKNFNLAFNPEYSKFDNLPS